MSVPTEKVEEAPKPCAVKDGKFVEPCWALRSVLNAPHSKQPGLIHRSLMNFTTFQPSRSYVVLRFERKDIVLNHCPFCGERINAPVRD